MKFWTNVQLEFLSPSDWTYTQPLTEVTPATSRKCYALLGAHHLELEWADPGT